jgi:uncharacterized membrane protein required for colicin V production
MNYLDYIFIGIIGISGLIAFGRGLIKTVFSLFSMVITVGLAYLLYPTVSELLIKYTEIDAFLRAKIIEGFNLESLAENVFSVQDQIKMINDLNIPDMFKEMLVNNNNSEIYQILNVDSIAEYIGGFFSTIAINALAFLITFLIVGILLKIVAVILDIVSKLPVLHQINRIGGLAFGLILGVLIVWVVCVAISLIVGISGNSEILVLIESSTVAQFFYENNLVMYFITDITKTLVKL